MEVKNKVSTASMYPLHISASDNKTFYYTKAFTTLRIILKRFYLKRLNARTHTSIAPKEIILAGRATKRRTYVSEQINIPRNIYRSRDTISTMGPRGASGALV